METQENINFEQSMGRLEEIVSTLERGDAPLERSLQLFEEGLGLMRACTQVLDTAEQKVRLLVAGAEGEPQERPFLEGDGDEL